METFGDAAPTTTPNAPRANDPATVDRHRLIALVDELERDIALIEGAMADVENRDFSSAGAALDVLDGVSSR